MLTNNNSTIKTFVGQGCEKVGTYMPYIADEQNSFSFGYALWVWQESHLKSREVDTN